MGNRDWDGELGLGRENGTWTENWDAEMQFYCFTQTEKPFLEPKFSLALSASDSNFKFDQDIGARQL